MGTLRKSWLQHVPRLLERSSSLERAIRDSLLHQINIGLGSYPIQEGSHTHRDGGVMPLAPHSRRMDSAVRSSVQDEHVIGSLWGYDGLRDP